ncbi:MAG: pyridoxamine 5'-phosphate oxidase family protein [Proteobacteria bacterium]|nr:pyridoxamine 5'-phosphate oxidase family protein [Pseudomonadota bacterium]
MNLLDHFFADRQKARDEKDSTANLCWAASVSEGAPQVRTLILRDLHDRLALFINATSPMWHELEKTPGVAIVAFFGSLNVQYRFDCLTQPIADHKVHESWHLRPDPPKRMDWFYTRTQPQSSVIADRSALLDALADLDLPEPLVAPPTARGLYLNPHRIERLDLTQPNGVHDRVQARLVDGQWVHNTLVP